ncbi:MAG: hypothetical protein KAS32_09160 [Candidatus Peribacteraceae bacterium]|nr:hypothetical protein [Candidatus Peribacteraceae bacterium]
MDYSAVELYKAKCRVAGVAVPSDKFIVEMLELAQEAFDEVDAEANPTPQGGDNE